MIITIDGPAGTGKTTVARRVAECLHFAYFDTGAMYRAVAWMLLDKGIEITDQEEIEKELSKFKFYIKGAGKEKRYFLGDRDITQDIRTRAVTSIVSPVSALPSVRKLLWKLQKEWGAKGDAVFEGRDMGTVVFPNAEIKIFLTARPEIRAQRRLDEMFSKKSPDVKGMDHKKMLEEIMKRDELDSSRSLAPLRCAEDAHLIDTSDLSIDEVVGEILRYKMSKFKSGT